MLLVNNIEQYSCLVFSSGERERHISSRFLAAVFSKQLLIQRESIREEFAVFGSHSEEFFRNQVSIFKQIQSDAWYPQMKPHSIRIFFFLVMSEFLLPKTNHTKITIKDSLTNNVKKKQPFRKRTINIWSVKSFWSKHYVLDKSYINSKHCSHLSITFSWTRLAWRIVYLKFNLTKNTSEIAVQYLICKQLLLSTLCT